MCSWTSSYATRKGGSSGGLKADNFQIFDNGEPHAIHAFRLVQWTEAVEGRGVRSKLDPLREIRLITMAFQSSSPNPRRRHTARKSSLVLPEHSSERSISTVTFVPKWKNDLPGKDRDPLRVADKVVSA